MKVSNMAGGPHAPKDYQDSPEMDALQATRHGVFGRLLHLRKKKPKKNHVVDKAPVKGECDIIECEAPPAIIKPKGSLVVGPRKGDKAHDHIVRLPPITLRYNAPPTTIQMHYNVPGRNHQVLLPDLHVQGERVVTIERIVHLGPDTYTTYDGELFDERKEPDYRCEDVVQHGAGKGGTKKPSDSSSSSSVSSSAGPANKAPRKGYDTSSAATSSSSSSVSSSGKAPGKTAREAPEKLPEKQPTKDYNESCITSSDDAGHAPCPPNHPVPADPPKAYDEDRAGPAFPGRYLTQYNG